MSGAYFGSALAVALALLAAVGRARDGEGPLENDVFLPVARQAAEHLARGDGAWAESRAAKDADARERALASAFEAWRSALTASATGDAVPPPSDTAWRERGTEGVELAVERRLTALAPDAQRAWSARFAELALGELGNAHDAVTLAGVARRNPATRAAALASLRLADIELERGAPFVAADWCLRAQRHAALAGQGDDAALAGAIAARSRAADELARPPWDDPEHWRDATALRFVGRVALVDAGRVFDRRGLPELPGPPQGVLPGITRLADGRLAVQTSDRVVITPPRGRRIDSVFEPSALLGDDAPYLAARYFGKDRDWPLRPAAAGDGIVLVHGIALPGRREPNALMHIRPPAASPDPASGLGGDVATTSLSLPTLEWAVVGDRRVGPDGSVRVDPELAELAEAELQPGPLVVGSRVYVQVRRYDGDIRAWLFCFDLVTGDCLWKRLLAQGSGLYPREYRETGASPRSATPAQPLVLVERGAEPSRIFAGTNLGAGVLVDAADGRLAWSYRNRRRSAGMPGWSSNWAPSIARDEERAMLLWAPVDSDHLYRLRATAPAPVDGPATGAPRGLDEALAFVDGDAREALVLSRAGARRTLSAWRYATGGRIDGPYLAREEAFAGDGVASDTRAIIASDRGLYLFDRTRELFLLDYAPFPEGVTPAGGTVVALGGHVFVVGERTVWTFFAE